MDEDTIRKVLEENARLKEEREADKKRADDAEKARLADKKRTDEEIARLKEAREADKKRADDAEKARLADKKRADEEGKARLAEKKRADEAEAKNEKTVYLNYLQNIQTEIPPTLSVETDRKQAALGKAAKVDSKVYPRKLRRWTDFPQLHRRRFDMLTTLFGDDGLFPTYNDSKSVAENLSPSKRRDEQDIRPFIRAYLEVPSMKIVNEFLQMTDDERYAKLAFRFGNNPLGASLRKNVRSGAGTSTSVSDRGSNSGRPSQDNSPFTKRKLDSPASLAPDRWGLRLRLDETNAVVEPRETILPGEYKAAHKVRGDDIRNVLGGAPLSETFIDDCAKRRRGDSGVSARDNAGNGDNGGDADEQQRPVTIEMRLESIKRRQDEMTIAEVLCQAYHYMIFCGTSHGYVTSGEATVLLMLSPEDADCLLYHFVDHAVPAVPIRQPMDDLVHVPAAQLATLVLEALLTDLRDPADYPAVAGKLLRWPSPPKKLKVRGKLPGRGDDNDNNDNTNMGGGGDGSSANPPPPPPPGGGASGGTGQPGAGGTSESSRPVVIRERPRQNYCTQKCLLGLCRGGPLDPSCPNTLEHAHGERRKTGAAGQQLHAITPAELCAMLLEQLTRNLGSGVECLMKYGMFGAIGMLFKVTLCAYGYTFVAKAGQDADKEALKDEAAIYTNPATQPLQGVLMPVYIGWVELEEYPFILSTGACLWHLMLMSWAGVSLDRRMPDEIDDLDDAVDDIEDVLMSHGIFHNDIRLPNLVWNKELERLMIIDFHLADIQDVEDNEDHMAVKAEEELHVPAETGKTEAVEAEEKWPVMQVGLNAEKRKYLVSGLDGAESKRQRV